MRGQWQKAGRPLTMVAGEGTGGRRALTAQMAPVREKADVGRAKLVAASWQPVAGTGGASSSTDLPSGASVHLAAVDAAEDSVESEDDVVSSLLVQPAAAGAAASALAASSSSTTAWSVPTPLGRRTPLAGRRQ